MKRHSGWPAVLSLLLIVHAPRAFASAGCADEPLRSMLDAGTKLQREGKYEPADKALRAALEEAQRLDPFDPRIAVVEVNLASVSIDRARFAEAERWSLLAISNLEKNFGPHSQTLITPLVNLGALYNRLALYSKAQAACERAIAIARAKLNAGDPHLAVAVSTLADVYASQGKSEVAARLYRESVQSLEGCRKRCQVEAATVWTALSGFYEKAGRYPDALSAAQSAIALFEQELGTEHPKLIVPLARAGRLCARNRELGKADGMLQRAIGIAESALGPHHPTLAAVLSVRAEVLREANRKREARSDEARARTIRAEIRNSFSQDVIDVLELSQNPGGKRR